MLSADVHPFESRTPLLLWKSDTKRNNKDNDKNNNSANINTNLFMSLLGASFVIFCLTDSSHNILFIIPILILIIDIMTIMFVFVSFVPALHCNLPPQQLSFTLLLPSLSFYCKCFTLYLYTCTILCTCLLACMHAEPYACLFSYLECIPRCVLYCVINPTCFGCIYI